MCVWERVEIYLKRNKRRGMLLLIVLILISSALLFCMSFWEGSQKSIRQLRSIYGNNFTLDFNFEADGEVPLVNDDMINKIISVGGIRDVCKINGTDLYFETLVFIPGLYIEGMAIEEAPEGKQNALFWSKTMHLTGCNKSELNHYFQTNTFELVQGRHIEETDYNKVLISDEVAKINNLKIGDIIHGKMDQRMIDGGDYNIIHCQVDLEIVGIFHSNVTQVTNQYTAEGDIAQNKMFTDCRTMEEVRNVFNKVKGFEKAPTYGQVVFFVEDPKEIESIIERVKKIDGIDWNMLELNIDDTMYQAALTPLKTIIKISIFMIIFVVLICVILLTLILKIWIKTRKKEMGILLSMGNSQREIAVQFVLEGMVILGIGFAIACGITAWGSNKIGNRMLVGINENEKRLEEQQRQRQKEMMEEIPESFDEYMAIVEQFEVEAEVEIPEELECRLSIQIAALSGILMLVVLVVVTIFAARETLKMEPKDILTSL